MTAAVGQVPAGRVAAGAAAAVRWRLLLAGALGVGAAGSAVALMATSAWLISRAAQHPPVLYLMVAIVAVRFFGIARGVLRYAERLVGHDAALRGLRDLRVDVYRRLERLAPSGLPAFRSGDLLARLVGDVDALQDLWLRIVLPYASFLVVGGGAVGLVWWLLPPAGVLLLVALAVSGGAVPWLAAHTARRRESAVAPLRGELAADAAEMLRGAPEMAVNGTLPGRLARLDVTDQKLTAAAAASARAAGAGAALAVLAGGAAVWGALGLGAPAVRAGELDGVTLAVLVLTPLALVELVVGLPAAAQNVGRVRRSLQRVAEVMAAPEPVTDPAHPVDLPAGPVTVELRGVSARWRPDAPLALHDVDLVLPPGRRIAVVGASGSGKSTLAAVLLRFLDVCAGRMVVGGVDAAAAAADDVRRVVGLCAQDAHVFDSTIRENLRLARPGASEPDLHAALAAAGLAGMVAALPDGLDTFVGEHGSRLSGGERQRLALARSLLADFPVLVLDEPTEHLDADTADALTRDLLAATAGRSTVLITHRLAHLDQVDEVVVLDRGRVVQRGRAADLAAVPGPFRRLLAGDRIAA